MDKDFISMELTDDVTENLCKQVGSTPNDDVLSAKPRPFRRFLTCARRNLMPILTLTGAVVGTVIGLFARQGELCQRHLYYIRFPGELFLRMMKMFIIPIVISSLVTSSARLEGRATGRIGLRIAVYFAGTLVIASCLGILMALAIRPGENVSATKMGRPTQEFTSDPVFVVMDLLRNLFADNIFEACMMKTKTIETISELTVSMTNLTAVENSTVTANKDVLVTKEEGVNMIGLILASLSVGFAIRHVGLSAQPLLDFFEAVFCVSIKVVMTFLWFTPVGILSLVAASLANLEDAGGAFREMGLFIGTFLSAIAFHCLIFLPALFYLVVRQNPFRFQMRLTRAMITAFVTDSSAATIPSLIQCLEGGNKVDSRVSRQISTLGATINKHGGTLYFPIVPIFVAQNLNIPLNIGQIITISLVTICMVAGHAPTSGGGIVYIILLLTAVGLPTDGFALIFAIDWLLERFRTTVNVIGNGMGAGIIAHLSRGDLGEKSPSNTEHVSVEIPAPGVQKIADNTTGCLKSTSKRQTFLSRRRKSL